MTQWHQDTKNYSKLWRSGRVDWCRLGWATGCSTKTFERPAVWLMVLQCFAFEHVWGNNDGSKAGEHYFDCKGEKYGCFVRPDNEPWSNCKKFLALEVTWSLKFCQEQFDFEFTMLTQFSLQFRTLWHFLCVISCLCIPEQRDAEVEVGDFPELDPFASDEEFWVRQTKGQSNCASISCKVTTCHNMCCKSYSSFQLLSYDVRIVIASVHRSILLSAQQLPFGFWTDNSLLTDCSGLSNASLPECRKIEPKFLAFVRSCWWHLCMTDMVEPNRQSPSLIMLWPSCRVPEGWDAGSM